MKSVVFVRHFLSCLGGLWLNLVFFLFQYTQELKRATIAGWTRYGFDSQSGKLNIIYEYFHFSALRSATQHMALRKLSRKWRNGL